MKNVLIVLMALCFGNIYGLNDKQGVAVKVINVIDGNTVEILTEENEVYKIILKEVDSPEIGQEYGDQAKKFTEGLLLKKKVFVEMKGKDMWGNRLASITLKNGKKMEEELLKAGMAWHNTLKSTDITLAQLESNTKDKKVGLWANTDPMAPWIFRRQQSMTSAKSL